MSLEISHSAVPTKGWRSFKGHALTDANLDALFSNQIPYIIVPGVSSVEECRTMERVIHEVGFTDYQQVDPPIGRIGITQFEANKTDKDWYFSRASAAASARDQVSARSFDPLGRVIDLLQECSDDRPVSIANEAGYGKYFAGLTRRINSSALVHADFAPYDAPGWDIGELVSQLAWNIYLRLPTYGGDCIVYNRQWDQDAEAFRISGSYGYRPALVDEAESKVIKPAVGDLVLFNSRNFHEVAIGSGDRLSVSSFVGRKKNGDLILWS